MFTKDQTKYEHKPHVDFEDVQHHVMLYYVKESLHMQSQPWESPFL